MKKRYLRNVFILFTVSLSGHEGEIVGVVDFWARLFPPAEPVATVAESGADWKTVRHRSPVQITLGWQDSIHEVNQREDKLMKAQ